LPFDERGSEGNDEEEDNEEEEDDVESEENDADGDIKRPLL
jgi:hypothetical protein